MKERYLSLLFSIATLLLDSYQSLADFRIEIFRQTTLWYFLSQFIFVWTVSLICRNVNRGGLTRFKSDYRTYVSIITKSFIIGILY